MIWIGPRHTNYGHGSVCSFDTDNVLQCENPLLRQIDLISCWIVRQIHLLHFDFWPGPQRLHTAHERMTEHQPGELCGCGELVPYELCHKPTDELMTPEQRLAEFKRQFPNPSRKPPIAESEITELFKRGAPARKRVAPPT